MRDKSNGLHPMHRALSRPILPGIRAALLAFLALIGASLAAPVALAQSPFSAALYVNDFAITNYEVTQKMRFLEFLGASGDNPRERAIERLIEDRLQLQEAQRLGGRLTPDQIDTGMAEFAARAQLTTDEMIERLAAAGIDRETFETFIRAGVFWRELVQSTYGSQISITEAQIDQALSVEGVQPVTEVLISEIFLPNEPQFEEALQRIIPQIQRIRTETEFANAARQVSAAPSASSGGRIERWVNVAVIPPEVGTVMQNASIGTVVGPIEVPGAFAFFQLRARRNSRSVPDSAIELAFHRVPLAGGRTEANLAIVEQVRNAVDSCGDFPAEVLRAQPSLSDTAVAEIVRPQSEIAASTRSELERMNPGQVTANLVEDNALVMLMLCRRTVSGEGVPSRAQVRLALRNVALEGYGMLYLQRLRANADIRYP
ncbi:MAG: peptidylprolyl isomerase [Rhodobacteraceae bacterium]|jgi:peptidyl-prolyl cis-trans isomerase SurA|nr:peptidylprolyl isomerase [Paracoccaceae bacterium]